MAFEATLVRFSADGWVFAPVPKDYAPPAAGPFGRVPVIATVDGKRWPTSVWRDSHGGWLLAVPARVRRRKNQGDRVAVDIEIDGSRL